MKATFNQIAENYFNSIKVQLKLIPFQRIIAQCQFQFHKGTIKTTIPVHR